MSPLIILCPARSFSSVVCSMLGQHPQLYGFPELHLFTADTVEALLRYWKERKAFNEEMFREWFGAAALECSTGLLRALAELHFGGQTAEAVGEALAWLRARSDWSTRQLFDFLLEAIRPRMGVEKTPETAMSPAYMARARALYPDARFLHLTRHPVTAQRSMQNHWGHRMRKRRPEATGSDMAAVCAREWSLTHQAILDFTARLPPEQTLRVRGEDLLNEPDTHLPRVMAWLGLRTDAEAIEAMKHPERSPYAEPGPATARLGYDPKFLRNPELRPCELPAGLEHPREWGLDPWLLLTILELARHLGYGAVGGSPGKPAASEQAVAAGQHSEVAAKDLSSHQTREPTA
jgi:hypothetical protein